MISDPSSAGIYTDFSGFENLRVRARENSPEALKAVATQFEAMFIQMMLKSMRDANLSDGMFDSQQSEFYLGMFDQQIALDLSAKSSLGIADMMMQQLGEHKPGQAVSIREGAFDSPDDFISTMRPLANRAADRLDINPDILLAQSALETGWGQKIIQSGDGTNSHNLFGIKSDNRWDGQEVRVSSIEYTDGLPRRETSTFRAYDSYSESFDDYVDFIGSSERYREAVQSSHDPERYIRKLQESGYATDPEYANKVISILKRELL